MIKCSQCYPIYEPLILFRSPSLPTIWHCIGKFTLAGVIRMKYYKESENNYTAKAAKHGQRASNMCTYGAVAL